MGRQRESGIALISVVGVLVLLGLVVTPFMMTQRDSAARGDRFLYTARTSLEADSLFALVRSEMLKTVEHVEYEQLRDLGPSASAQGGKRPPQGATPSSDTLAEFELSPALLARFNEQEVRGGRRVWDVDVIDQQSLLNLNGASALVLANVIGRSELADAIEADGDLIPVTDASVFPAGGGVVRIGSEVIKYTGVSGSALIGCERGYRSDLGVNGSSAAWEKGDPVLLESAVQIALRPFLARKGSWLRYTNVYQARTIAAAGVTALSPESFDRLRRVSTVWSGNVVGDGWCNPQLVQEALSAGSAGEVSVQIKNPRYFGPGTIVKITDGVNSDYGMVAKVKGDLTITLVGDVQHSYEADQTYMYALARTPVNVNTASLEMLTLVFDGLKLRGRGTAFDRNRAEALAKFLKQWDNPNDEDAAPGTYRSWEDFTLALERARDDGVISQEDAQAVLLNAMNANDAALHFSTVPFCFRSYDIYELRAIASIQDSNNGRELARRELRRVVSIGTSRSGTLVLESQDDFQRQIMKSRTGRWWASFPDNVNAYYDGRNIPASEYAAFMNENRFPSSSRDAAEGDLQLLPAATRYVGRRNPDRVHHFDSSDVPDGLEIEGGGYTLTVGEQYSVQDRTVNLVQFREGPDGSDEREVGIRPFAVSFWYRPRWERGGGSQTIFDYAAEDEHINRVRLYYDDERDLLVLAVADASAENRSYEVFYDFADHTWEADQWYHVAASVQGAGPGLCELFLDGEKVGRAAGITRLSQSIPETGDIATLRVESTEGFPERGTLFVQGQDGAEFIEYDGIGENSFTVVRRKARTINRVSVQDVPRGHSEGDVVELYGFSGPLYTDIKTGGATLGQTIGPWRAYRLIANDPSDFDSISATDPNGNPVTFIGIGASPSDANQVVSGIQLQDWDTGSTDPTILGDLGAVGSEGVAMIACGPSDIRITVTGGGTYAAGPNAGQAFDELINQHVEFVRYRVTGVGTVELVQRRLDLVHHQMAATTTGNPRFIPSYDYGDSASPQTQPDGNGQPGFLTAFIPIALVAQGSADSYLNPLDGLPHLSNVQSTRFAYVQVDGEWIKYDTADDQVISGAVAFYHDQRIDDAAQLFNAGGTLDYLEPVESPSTSTPGGPGSGAPGSEPPRADDLNTDDDLPSEASASGSLPPPPFDSQRIAEALDFRGYVARNAGMEFYVANTIPREHQSGTAVVPCFRVVPGNEVELSGFGNAIRGAYPGYNDLLTLRDAENSIALIRIQWGYGGWCAPTDPLGQNWGWDQLSSLNPAADLRRLDSRRFTRALLYPSGELPDIGLTTAQQPFGFGVEGLEGGVSEGTLDELVFLDFPESPDDRPNWSLLGEVPPEVIQAATGTLNLQPGQPAPEPSFDGVDAEADTIRIHTSFWDPEAQAYNVSGLGIAPDLFQEEGGILKINDELILYEAFDPATGEFTGCLRGTFGTTPQTHSYNSRVSAVRCFATSVLTSSADASSASFQLADSTAFPDDGYLRIADTSEIIGYTERDGNSLNGPLGRIDPAQASEPGEDARVGGGLFRGRFGTKTETYRAGDVVVHMPSRYYDRYAEFSDHPEMAYAQFSWNKPGAIWKRISWAQRPVESVEIIALLRFSGGPPWDSADIVRLPSGDIPKVDRRSKIYEISATDKGQLNLLNVEADRLEVRLLVRYADGAYRRIYDANGEPVPNAWKESPWVKKLTVEYVAPTLVLSQE